MAKTDTIETEKHGYGVFSLLCYLNTKKYTKSSHCSTTSNYWYPRSTIFIVGLTLIYLKINYTISLKDLHITPNFEREFPRMAG